MWQEYHRNTEVTVCSFYFILSGGLWFLNCSIIGAIHFESLIEVVSLRFLHCKVTPSCSLWLISVWEKFLCRGRLDFRTSLMQFFCFLFAISFILFICKYIYISFMSNFYPSLVVSIDVFWLSCVLMTKVDKCLILSIPSIFTIAILVLLF